MSDDISLGYAGWFPHLPPIPRAAAYTSPEQPRRGSGRPKRGEGYETMEPIRPPPMPVTESSDTVIIDPIELARGLAIARATMPEPELAPLVDDIPDEPPTTPACPDAKRSSVLPRR